MFGVLGTSGASISRYQIHQPVMYNPQYSTRSFSLLTFLIGGDRGGPIPFPVRRNVWGVGDQWGQQISRNQIHQPVMYNPQYSTRSFSLLTFQSGAIGVDQILFRCGEMFGVLGTSGASKFH